MKYHLLLVLLIGLLSGCGGQKGPDPKSEEQVSDCTRRMQMIDHAKAQWAQENQKTTSDIPKAEDLTPLLRGIPGCPSGGTYTLTHVGELTTCSVPEHNAAYKKSVETK